MVVVVVRVLWQKVIITVTKCNDEIERQYGRKNTPDKPDGR